MSWSEVFYMMTGQPQLQAALIGLAWIKADESGDMALLSNLLCNMLHPTGVCQALDHAGTARSAATLTPNAEVKGG